MVRRVSGQCWRMRRTRRRRWPRISAPDGVLPGRSSTATGRAVVDMDRQKAALAVVAVEQGELLMPVHDVGRVVDVEGDGGRWAGIAGAIEVDQGVGHAHHLAPS